MNNLKELFEIQGGLDSEINKNHPIQPGENRLEKKHVALLVELGEMFNEWRAFKFWSTDQKPRTNVDCIACEGDGTFYYPSAGSETCPGCKGTGKVDKLLGELVDCLHFILSIGLELSVDYELLTDLMTTMSYQSKGLESSFIRLMQLDWSFNNYIVGFRLFLGFCVDLGYTWEQVTEAYLIKNQENHYRQMNGY